MEKKYIPSCLWKISGEKGYFIRDKGRKRGRVYVIDREILKNFRRKFGTVSADFRGRKEESRTQYEPRLD